MSPRARRLVLAVALLATLLFAGRWAATLLADQWWTASVAPAAGPLLTRRALLGLLLDALGILAATLWFFINGRVLWTTIHEIGPRERGGNLRVRQVLRHPSATGWGLVGIVVLGLVMGSGVSTWIDAVELARVGVTFGLVDPALGIDAGRYVAWLPVWLRVQAFDLALILTAMAIVGLGVILSGAVRVGRGKVAITDRARRHLGVLLSLFGLTIGSSQILTPYQFAAGLPHPVAPGVAELHQSVSMILVGVSLAAAALSLVWAMRPVHSLLAGGWLVFSAALVGADALLPDTRPDPRDGDFARTRGKFEAVAYGLETHPDTSSNRDFRPALWDGGLVARVAGHDTLRTPSLASRFTYQDDHGSRSAWTVPVETADSITLLVQPDDTLLALGRVQARLAMPSVRPGAPPVEAGDGGAGVRAGGMLRRTVLAWALEARSVFGIPPGRMVGWYLAPEARLRHVAPFAMWTGSRAWFGPEGLRWVVDGYVTTDAFPIARRRAWQGRNVALVRAGFVGVVNAANGRVSVYLRPGADSLSRALARTADELVQAASDIPPALSAVLGYPADLLPLQAELLAARDRSDAPGATGSFEVAAAPGTPPLPGASAGTFSVVITEVTTDRLHQIVTGRHDENGDHLLIYQPDGAAVLDAPDVLARRWQRFPFWEGLRDSVSAAGASLAVGRVRYAIGPDGLMAYQPVRSVSSGGSATAVLVVAARGARLAAGRSLDAAVDNLTGPGAGFAGLAGTGATLDEARRWAAEADSALRRGDFAAFGRAFGRLRAVLDPKRPEVPK